MTEVRYSLSEIDRIRSAVRAIVDFEGMGICYRETERAADAEDRTRTYMLAGISPEELERECDRLRAGRVK